MGYRRDPQTIHIDNPNLDELSAQLADTTTRIKEIKISIIGEGGNYDGVTDNLTAFNNAKTKVGSKGTIFFPQNPTGNAVYYFSANPAMTGLTIDADEGVVLSFPSTNSARFSGITFQKDIKIQSRDRNNTGALLDINSNEWLAPLVAGDILRQVGIQNAIAMDATTFEKKQYNTQNDTISVGVATLTSSRQVDWSLNLLGTTNAGLIDVVQFPVQLGKEYLTSFKSSANNTNGRGGILLNSGGEWVLFSLGVNSTKQWFLGTKRVGVSWSEISGTTPSGAYTVQGAAQPILSVRVVSLTEAEFYVNGVLMTRYNTNGGFIQQVGFGWNGAANNTASLSLFNFVQGDVPAKPTGKNLKLSIYGDSISFGEGSNLPWTDLLKYSLRGLNGIASISITNNAVSGEKASQQLSRLQTNGVVGFDYTLVMVGTNDIQAQTPYETYRQNLLDIIAKIRTDGSVPIIGVPPMFIDSGSTGYGFNTSNYGQGGVHRSIVFQVCAEQGVTIADVMTDFGRIDPTNVQLRDNIHPTSFADTFIARTFARAILFLEKSKEVSILPSSRKEGSNTIAWVSSLPSSGSWTKGDIAYNTNVSVLGTAGSQYTILGWRRLTNGYGNVLNTDWVEMRQLTGS